MPEPSFIKTSKTVSQTLADLRRLFSKWAIEDWEPIPVEYYQPTKAMNLRVCYQVIDNMFRWEARGVSGLVKGTAFMGGNLVATGRGERESFDEACAILGVEPEASWEEIDRVYKVKVQFAHPDKGGDPQRFKRIQKSYDYLRKVKGPKGREAKSEL